MKHYTRDDVIRIVEDEDVEFIRLQFTDMFGNLKNGEAIKGFALPVIMLGQLKGEEEVRKAYEGADIVVSASSYETLPGTLVEAQAYGCIPVSFNQGGQGDIIDNRITGYIADYDDKIDIRAKNLAQGIVWAVEICDNPAVHKEMLRKMEESVYTKFAYEIIAKKYLSLIEELKDRKVEGEDGG